MVDVDRARRFVHSNARVLERHRFAYLFDGGEAGAVLRALTAYRNADGGFGNALEPDLRVPASQPVAAEVALRILFECGHLDHRVVEDLIDWCEASAIDGGGLPFALASAGDGPAAPWWSWQSFDQPSVNPTAAIVGLLIRDRFDYPWVVRAEAYCWNALSGDLDQISADDALAVMELVEARAGSDSAAQLEARLRDRVVGELVALDPEASGYVHSPLAFARTPQAIARSWFDDDVIELHLEAVAARQHADGGWPINWEPPIGIAAMEWRPIVTIEALKTLRAYGRLPVEPSRT